MKSSPTILLAEDEIDLRTLYSHALMRAGFNVIDVDNGQHALAVLKNVKIDLLITDLQMPQLNGFELLEKMLKLIDKPHVILISASDKVDSKIARGAGACRFLKKPISNLNLIAAARSCLESDRRCVGQDSYSLKKSHF